MQISDYSGQLWITVFNDEAEKMLNGKTADELNLIMQSDHNKFAEVMNSLTLRPMRFTLRVKVENHNDENRVKAVAKVARLILSKRANPSRKDSVVVDVVCIVCFSFCCSSINH